MQSQTFQSFVKFEMSKSLHLEFGEEKSQRDSGEMSGLFLKNSCFWFDFIFHVYFHSILNSYDMMRFYWPFGEKMGINPNVEGKFYHLKI